MPNPGNISTAPVLWLDASALSAGTLSSWTGNVGSAAQSNAALKPTAYTNVQNGLSVARFVAQEMVLTMADQAAGNWTLFCALNPSQIDGFNYVLDIQTGRLVPFLSYQNTYKVGWRDGAGNAVHIATATTGWQILTWKLTSPTATIYRNGSSLGSGAYSQTAIGGAKTLFGYLGNDGTQCLHADLAEIILFPGGLSDADRIKVENYLNGKWHIYLPYPGAGTPVARKFHRRQALTNAI
jgi:hypothetical protein